MITSYDQKKKADVSEKFFFKKLITKDYFSANIGLKIDDWFAKYNGMVESIPYPWSFRAQKSWVQIG